MLSGNRKHESASMLKEYDPPKEPVRVKAERSGKITSSESALLTRSKGQSLLIQIKSLKLQRPSLMMVDVMVQ
jgi:hypothetical protein